jgi:hypothetical protein
MVLQEAKSEKLDNRVEAKLERMFNQVPSVYDHFGN